MKMVKLFLATVLCIVGVTPGLWANSSSTDTATNLANAQATYLSQLANTLNATTWASYLTINGANYNTRDVLYGAIQVTNLPDLAAVWEATYKSLQQGAGLAFLAVAYSLTYTISDIAMLQSRLNEAKANHPNDSRLGAIQYTLYMTFLNLAGLNAGTITDFWTDIQYGVPIGSPTDTTIFDLVINNNNLPGDGATVAQLATGAYILGNPQNIFTKALIHGVDLAAAAKDLQKLRSFKVNFDTARTALNITFNPDTQEKFYCGFLAVASAAATLNDFFALLTEGGNGRNIFEIILDTGYKVYNQNSMVNALAAAFIKGITLSTTLENLNTFQNYVTLAKTKYSTADFSSVLQALTNKKAPYVETPLITKLQAVLTTKNTQFDDNLTLLKQALVLTMISSTNATTFLTAFSLAFYVTTSQATSDQCNTLFSLIANVPTWLNSSVPNFQQAITRRIQEIQLITNLKAATTVAVLLQLLNIVLVPTYTPISGTDFTDAVGTAFTAAINAATTPTDLTQLRHLLAEDLPSYISSNVAALKTAINQKQQQLQDAAAKETQFITNLNAVTATTLFTDIVTLLQQALALTTITNTNLARLVNAFGNACKIATGMATLAQCDSLSSLLASVPQWLSSSGSSLQQTITARKTALQQSDTETQLITKLNAVTATTLFTDIVTLLQQALALTTITNTNLARLVNAFGNAFNIAAGMATSDQCDKTLSPLLTNVPPWFSSRSATPLQQSITDRKAVLLESDAETQLITNLTAAASATKLSDLTPYLTQAIAIATPLTTNVPNLTTAFTNAFNHAVSLATSSSDITTLTGCLPPAQGSYLSDSRTNLAAALTTKQQQIKAASDAAAAAAAASQAEQQLITNLTAAASAIKLSDITPYLTSAIQITAPLAANVPNLTTAFTNAFNRAISLATSTADITTLTNCLPPAQGSYLSGSRANLAAALTTKQQQIQAASDAAAAAAAASQAEQQLITNLKAATSFAALLPLLTTALASTYTPVNATNITSAVVPAFTAAIATAASLADLTQLSNLLKTPPTYISSNVTTLTSAITTRQQQLQAANNTTTETTIISTLKSSTASLDTLFSNLDTVLVATYQPINLTNLKTAVLAGLTRSITLITTSNYTTVQTKIATYISNATPKYLTTAQKTSLSNSLATKIKSIRTSLISSFTSKITSFTSAVAKAIAARTTPAAVLAQRQTMLTDAIQKAAGIIDAHTQLAPSTSERALANLRSAYTSFNSYIIKLIQDQGFIKKTVSGKNTTYALAYNATAAEPKTSLKKVLNFMLTSTSFPQLSTTQKNIMSSINAAIV